MKEENKMTVGKLKELLSKYNDNDQVILSTGIYMERGKSGLKPRNSHLHRMVGMFCI